MFHFLRRYQRVIFFIVTAIIILSFSFFGTYSAMVSTKGDDPLVFTTLSGRKIRRSESQAYLAFLSTGSTGGPSSVNNFFNDGFLERDILSTCVGQSIMHQWKERVAPYLGKKKMQESQFSLYHHPKAPFLGTEYVWTYFIPELKDRFMAYQKESSKESEEIFKKKAALFVLEKQFPGTFVKQLLLLQQQQAAEWLEPDATLQERDFSLFGYTSANDWFGEEYMQKVVCTLLDGAEMAQKEGMRVSDDEVMNSLYRNVQSNARRFSDLNEKPLHELVQLSLRSLGLDLAMVQKIWRDILLFRQAFTALPNHMAISAFPFRTIYEEGAQYRKIEKYSLQPCLNVHSLEDMAALYVWQKACLMESNAKPFLGAYRPAEEVMKAWPEFVQERYCISYRMVGPEQLEPLIRLKDLWHWQGEEKNFLRLAEKFPRLLEERREDPESRMQAIELLPSSMRVEVDAFSKKQFLLERPEWIDEQLKTQEMKTKTLFVHPEGEAKDWVGITNVHALHELLQKSPLGEKSDQLSRYTQDGDHFYEMVVVDRSSQWELAPLIQLREEGTLARVLNKLLEAQYPVLRKQTPRPFLDEKGEWKPFHEVRLALVEAYLAPLFQVFDAEKTALMKQYPLLCQWDNPQEVRFALFFEPLFRDNRKKMDEGVSVIAQPLQYEDILSGSKESIEKAQQTVFDFIQTTEKIRKDDLEKQPQLLPLFAKDRKQDELLVYTPRFGLSFIKVVDEGQESSDNELRSTLYSFGDLLAESPRREKVEKLFQSMADTGT